MIKFYTWLQSVAVSLMNGASKRRTECIEAEIEAQKEAIVIANRLIASCEASINELEEMKG